MIQAIGIAMCTYCFLRLLWCIHDAQETTSNTAVSVMQLFTVAGLVVIAVCGMTLLTALSGNPALSQ